MQRNRTAIFQNRILRDDWDFMSLIVSISLVGRKPAIY
jgi:hypothetical protein